MTTTKTLNAAMILLSAALTYSGVANAQAEPLTFLTKVAGVMVNFSDMGALPLKIGCRFG